jgi:hypothetical protein
MGMDFLRSCYKTKVVVWNDFPRLEDVEWYFCKPLAKSFPYQHAYGSLNWGKFTLQGPGEKNGAARPWYNGVNRYGYNGQDFCGNRLRFLEGASITTPLVPPLICCGEAGLGGIRLRGQSDTPPGPLFQGQGGYSLTGEATLATGFTFTGSGGTSSTGEGDVRTGIAFTGTGGFELTGEADLVGGDDLAFPGVGGYRFTGDVPFSFGPVTGADYMPTIWTDEGDVISGNALVFYTNQNQPYCTTQYQNVPANGDTREWKFWIPESTSWTLYVLYVKQFNCGMVDFYIDGSLVSTGLDGYDPGLVWAQYASLWTGTLSEGQHTLRSVVNGKNGSSSDYYFFVTKYFFK